MGRHIRTTSPSQNDPPRRAPRIAPGHPDQLASPNRRRRAQAGGVRIVRTVNGHDPHATTEKPSALLPWDGFGNVPVCVAPDLRLARTMAVEDDQGGDGRAGAEEAR